MQQLGELFNICLNDPKTLMGKRYLTAWKDGALGERVAVSALEQRYRMKFARASASCYYATTKRDLHLCGVERGVCARCSYGAHTPTPNLDPAS